MVMEWIRRAWQRSLARGRPHGVLFVCAANLCRSPMAEHVLRTTLDRAARTRRSPRLVVASAGTHVSPRHEPPDPRAVAALLRRGYGAPRRSRSRALAPDDFDRFDMLLAMDSEVLAAMRALAPSHHAHKVRLMLDHAPGLEGQDVPDPYWGDQQGFERALDLCEAAAPGVLRSIEACIESTRRPPPA
jgi:protein-tyrosine phosphatase